ncbi:unnamed protein product [Umbelopsis sp. WA50703]
MLANYFWNVKRAPKEIFSMSLPQGEKLVFEEHFKYVVVSAGILREAYNPQVTTHPEQSSKDQKIDYIPEKHHHGFIFGFIVVPFILAWKSHSFSDGIVTWVQDIPTISLLLATCSFCGFFYYRHTRHVAIRKLYAVATSRLEDIISQYQQFDSQLAAKIQGYAQNGLSVNGNIKGNSAETKDTESKNAVRADLELCIQQFETFIRKLTPYTDQEHKTKLFDMYNIEPISHSSSDLERTEESLQQLEQLAQKMHLIRRECVTQLLALDTMADKNHEMRNDYVKTWALVNDLLQEMLRDATANVTKITKITSPKPKLPPTTLKQPLGNDSQSILQKLSALDRALRRVREKLQVCQNDIRTGSLNPQRSRVKLVKQFESISGDFQHIDQEWLEGKGALMKAVGSLPSTDMSIGDRTELPSPPNSPLFSNLVDNASLHIIHEPVH